MKRIYESILREIAENKIRPRPGRRNQRCVKRPRKTFPIASKFKTRSLPKFIKVKILK